MIIAGSADQRTRLAETRALFSRAHEPKHLWIVEGLQSNSRRCHHAEANLFRLSDKAFVLIESLGGGVAMYKNVKRLSSRSEGIDESFELGQVPEAGFFIHEHGEE